MFSSLISVGIGGFLGAVARYVLSGWIASRAAARLDLALPVGTLFVNVTGSFVLAVFLAWFANRLEISENWRLLIATGFCGSYTTFSTFAYETIATLRSGEWGGSIVYIIITNLLCLLMVAVGMIIGSRL